MKTYYFSETSPADAAGDAILLPQSTFLNMDVLSATSIIMQFKKIDGTHDNSHITITHAAGQTIDAMRALAAAMAGKNKIMKEKYLIFAEALTTEDVDNSDISVATTTALVNPVSLLNATSGSDGIIEVQLKDHADHDWGSHYGTPTAGVYVTIPQQGFTVHATSGVITIVEKSADDVYGVALSSTDANNDFRINLLKHIDGGTLACFPASKFKGMQTVDADETDLYFEAGTGDLDAVDVIKVTHAANKYKELAEMVNDAMSPAKSGAAVDFFVGGSTAAGTATIIDALTFNGNPAGITSVDIQLDS
jgi:hypothetical protein